MHTIMHHSSTYMPNFIEIKETFCGWTDGRKYIRTYGRTFETHFIRSTQKSQPKNRPTFAETSHTNERGISFEPVYMHGQLIK